MCAKSNTLNICPCSVFVGYVTVGEAQWCVQPYVSSKQHPLYKTTQASIVFSISYWTLIFSLAIASPSTLLQRNHKWVGWCTLDPGFNFKVVGISNVVAGAVVSLTTFAIGVCILEDSTCNGNGSHNEVGRARTFLSSFKYSLFAAFSTPKLSHTVARNTLPYRLLASRSTILSIARNRTHRPIT